MFPKKDHGSRRRKKIFEKNVNLVDEVNEGM